MIYLSFAVPKLHDLKLKYSMFSLKQGDKMKIQFPRMSKYFKFLFIIIILIFIVVTASFKVLMNGYENQIATLDESNENIRKNHISTMVLYANELATKQAGDVAERLTIKIKDAYPDLSVLENELNSGNLDNTKLVRIIYDEIQHAELFDINNPNNHLVVYLEDGYVFDNRIYTYGKPYHTFGEDHDIDSKSAFDTFLTGVESDDNHIFYSKTCVDYPGGKRQIISINQDEFYDKILNDLHSLDNYEVYAVAYITTDGDIFGHSDVSSDLKRNKTHKIVVVQSFNVNDVLLAKSDSSYKEAIRYNESLSNELREHMLLHSLFFILFFVLFLFSSLMSFFIFMNGKNCFRCNNYNIEETNGKCSTVKQRALKDVKFDKEKSMDNNKK